MQDIPGLPLVVVSGSEDASVLARLAEGGLRCVAAAGAGYKCLLTATASVSAYVCSKVCGTMYQTKNKTLNV